MARILGLELGENTIRGTLVRTALRKAEVLRYVEVPVEATAEAQPEAPGDTPDGAPEPPGPGDARRAAVQAVIAACDPGPDQVIVALDGREASLRAVELPAAAARRAAEVLPFELEPLLPFPAEDAILDHQVIEQDALTLRLLAAAVPHARVADLLSRLADDGVDPREVAVGAAALDGLGLLAPRLAEGVTLVLQVADGVANVCVMLKGQAAYGRTLAAADDWMREGSGFESELRRSLAAWRAAGGDPIDRAWIAGELPPAPAPEPPPPAAEGDGTGEDEAPSPTPSRAPPPPDPAAAWLHRVAGVPAERVSMPAADGATREDAARFAFSAALAARTVEKRKRFDLRRGDLAYTATGSALHRYARTVLVGAAAVLVAFAFATFAEWRVLAAEHRRLADELDRVSEEAFGQGTRSPSRARELLARGSRVDDPIPEVDAWDLLEFVNGAIPEDVPHSTRTFLVELDDEGGDGRFELVGSVTSLAERDAIAQAVEAHGCLKELERGSTSAEPGGEGRLRYQLEADIRCGEDEEQDDRRSRRGRR